MRLIKIVLVIQLMALVLDVIQLSLLKEISNGASVANKAMASNEARQGYIALVYMAVYLFSGVAFIQWFRRAYYNLHTLDPDLSWDESWAAASWFIPVLNLFRPFQIMREMYRKTLISLSGSGAGLDYKVSLTPVAWWWILWIAQDLIGAAIFYFAMNDPGTPEQIHMTRLSILGELLFIPLALVTLRVIREYAHMENLLGEAHPAS